MPVLSKLAEFVDRDVTRKGPVGGGLLCLLIGGMLAAAPTPFLTEPYEIRETAITSIGVALSVAWLNFINWRATRLLRSRSLGESKAEASVGRGPVPLLARSLDRWSRQIESSLAQLTKGKTFSDRIGGHLKSERVEAKYLALALAPGLIGIFLEEYGWRGSVVWAAFWSIISAWFLFVIPLGFVGYFRRYV